jgi:hypothetical protein
MVEKDNMEKVNTYEIKNFESKEDFGIEGTKA